MLQYAAIVVTSVLFLLALLFFLSGIAGACYREPGETSADMMGQFVLGMVVSAGFGIAGLCVLKYLS